jgi:transcriptional regulator with XRE-family HTH domain
MNGTSRRELANALKRLRLAAGLTGYQLATHLGVDQSTISRIERAQQRISIQQVDLWCKATNAPNEHRQELLGLAQNVLVGPKSWAEASATGSTNLQPETRDLEARSRVLSFYQPVSIPGLLQTPAYARRLLSSGPDGAPADLAKRVMDRMDRQHTLYDESKLIRFVITEAALRWPYGPPNDPAVYDEHHEQLARIEMATRRPNVQVGILPLQPLAVWRLGGFVIYDEVEGGQPQVHLEWLTRPYDVFEPDAVEFCKRAFANLLDTTVTGDQARTLIAQAMEATRARH